MSKVQFQLADTGTERFITVYVDGEVRACDDSHPSFDAICDAVFDGEEGTEILALFDVAEVVASRFESLSERVAVANGRVYFDGDEQDDTVTQQIVKALDHGREFGHLVAFMENVAANPNDHSREQLYDWLRQEGLTLNDEGLIVGYKAIRDGHSISSGTAIVNGERKSGRIPNAVGDVVEMPRTSVAHDPSQACSTGLHVATREYAESFGGDQATIIEVHVNPRDVVSVPTDGGGEKVRVCRYTVARVARTAAPARYRDRYSW